MKPVITIVSLGPGDPDLLNIKSINALRNACSLILRTANHPLTAWLDLQKISWCSLDHFYDTAEDFDELNRLIAEHILNQASCGHVVYAVPDAYSDHTVKALFAQAYDSAVINVVPGVGSTDHYLSGSLSMLNSVPLTISPASDLLSAGSFDPNQSLLITELDNPVLAGQIKILLSEALEDEHTIYLLRNHSGPVSLQLYQIDRVTDIDHMTAIFIPGSDFLSRRRFVMRDLAVLMEKLRSPGGCPWDGAQTHDSLQQYMIEEAWECVSSIDQHDPDHLCEELGDLLFQIVFHASIGSSFDEFTLADIITAVCSKMIRRHPHVFESGKSSDVADIGKSWEHIKRQETGHTTLISSLDDISSGLPSLKYASKTLKKLSTAKAFSRSPKEILNDITHLCSKIAANTVSADLGMLLFLCTELCFRLNTDSELILHKTVDQLKKDLTETEKLIKNDGKSLEHLTFDELGVYLKHVKDAIE